MIRSVYWLLHRFSFSKHNSTFNLMFFMGRPTTQFPSYMYQRSLFNIRLRVHSVSFACLKPFILLADKTIGILSIDLRWKFEFIELSNRTEILFFDINLLTIIPNRWWSILSGDFIVILSDVWHQIIFSYRQLVLSLHPTWKDKLLKLCKVNSRISVEVYAPYHPDQFSVCCRVAASERQKVL